MEKKPMTYTDKQPGNVDAWRIGEACRNAADDPKCGDYIDRLQVAELVEIINSYQLARPAK